jgi:hypothetical protein
MQSHSRHRYSYCSFFFHAMSGPQLQFLHSHRYLPTHLEDSQKLDSFKCDSGNANRNFDEFGLRELHSQE